MDRMAGVENMHVNIVVLAIGSRTRFAMFCSSLKFVKQCCTCVKLTLPKVSKVAT